jgi:hypothetical protein
MECMDESGEIGIVIEDGEIKKNNYKGWYFEKISSNNNTEIIIRNGMVVFKKGENIFVITPEQMFATTED